MTHRLDQQFSGQDPRTVARQIQARHPGWMVWYGAWTGEFSAHHPWVPRMVMNKTAAGMDQVIAQWEAWMRGEAGFPARHSEDYSTHGTLP